MGQERLLIGGPASALRLSERILPYLDEAFYVGFNVDGFELSLIPDGQAGTFRPA